MQAFLVLAIYKIRVLKLFYRSGALSEKSAVTPEVISVRITPGFKKLLSTDRIRGNSSGKYWLNVDKLERNKILWKIITL